VAAVPDLPVSVNALLNARARALAKGEKAEAAELRAELAKVGIVIRDEKTGQSWRYAGSPPPA
jgi:cysteinyl-tRNA synthetase